MNDNSDHAPQDQGPDANDVPPAEARASLIEHMRDIRTVMFTTVTSDGTLTSRPMTIQQVEDTGNLWFIGSRGSELAAEIRADDRVNVAFSSSDEWVSLSGRARVTLDLEKARELWDRSTDAWFEEGPEDPDVAMIHVDADSAQYWDTPGRVATLAAMLKASVTDEPDVGETAEVEL